MAKVAIRTIEQTTPAQPPEDAQGEIETCVYFDGDRHPLHLRLYRLSPGARLRLAAETADLSLFVWHGAVTAGDTELDERSSAVVQRGAELGLAAGDEGASLLLFNAGKSADAPAGAGQVLLLPNARVPRTYAMGGTEGVGGALHADAHAPTPNVWLHENDYAMADKETVLHSHTEDEVIFVRAGSVRLGNKLYGAGTAIAIAADTLYEFWSGPDGLGFVNFRGSSPTYKTADGSMVLDEAELWRKAVGKPEPIRVGAD